MKWTSRVPLAWLNMTHDKRRLVVALAGISFAVVLMCMELGFWNGMLDSMGELIDRFDADLVLVNRGRYVLYANEPFSQRRLEQAAAVDGVASARPLYMEYGFAVWKNNSPGRPNPDEPRTGCIRVLAFDPASPVLYIPALKEHALELQMPDTVLMDLKSKKHYGTHAIGTTTELGGHTVHVVGNFTLGTDFTSDGNLVMSDTNFARFFPQRGPRGNPLGQVDVGLIKIAKGANPQIVKRFLHETLPDDVEVFTKEEFAQQEQLFWQTSTPVGFIFFLGLAMGFVVGVIICYQILAADIMDHLPEFATLKAMGYSNRFLAVVVLQEAVLLAVTGYIPGVFLSLLLYRVLEDGTGIPFLLQNGTGLPMNLTLLRSLLVLGLTIFMCITSGLMVVRKVQAADPAEVF